MKFYEWTQNNTYGHFEVDENISHRVVIQAETYEQAEDKAFDFGIYYNGVETLDDYLIVHYADDTKKTFTGKSHKG